MKYIKFTDKDPRKGQVARMDDGLAQRLIDSGNATEISAADADAAGGAKAGATVSGTEDGRADRNDGLAEGSATVARDATGTQYTRTQQEGTATTGAAAPAPAPTSAPAPAPDAAPAPAGTPTGDTTKR